MRCPKCGKPLVCAACAGSVGGAARVAKGFASAEVQAKAQATRKRKARAAHDSHNRRPAHETQIETAARWRTPPPLVRQI